jgi:hypothetical protein
MRWWDLWRSSAPAPEESTFLSDATLVSPDDDGTLHSLDVPAAPAALPIQVDDTVQILIALSERNTHLVLDATERAREYREREKSSLAPVYNFGAEPTWSGGDW